MDHPNLCHFRYPHPLPPVDRRSRTLNDRHHRRQRREEAEARQRPSHGRRHSPNSHLRPIQHCCGAVPFHLETVHGSSRARREVCQRARQRPEVQPQLAPALVRREHIMFDDPCMCSPLGVPLLKLKTDDIVSAARSGLFTAKSISPRERPDILSHMNTCKHYQA